LKNLFTIFVNLFYLDVISKERTKAEIRPIRQIEKQKRMKKKTREVVLNENKKLAKA